MLILLSSCEKQLEEFPQNKVMPTTTEDYEQLLNRAIISRQIMPYLDILSDDVDLIETDHVQDGPDDGDAQLAAYMWQDRHETTMSGGDIAFSSFYESIFYCNLIIDGVKNAQGVELNPQNVERTKKQLEAQAYALRAYAYFYLVNLYAKPFDPTTAAVEQGVPINLAITAEDKAYTRQPVQEVYNLIVSDLEKSISILEANPSDGITKFKFTALAAKAFLARVHLYMNNWDQAIKYATEVTRANPSIFNLQAVGEQLNEGNNSGYDWEVTNILGRNYIGSFNENVLFVNGLNELMPALSYWHYITTFSVNKELADTFEPNDVRRFYFMQTFSLNTFAGLRVKLSYSKNRYINLGDTFSATPGSGYTRAIRTEEMYLILAEAYAHKTNGLEEAVKYLNTLREPKFRRGKYSPLVASSFNSESLLDYVFLERRRELCFEGHRWFDLRRHGMPAQTRIGYNNEVANLKQNDPKYVLQIPQQELNVNPQIGLTPR